MELRKRNEKKEEASLMNKLLFALICIALLIGVVLISGCISGGMSIDPCEREYSNCVHNCGEGILSSLCKQGCKWDRDKCKKNK